MVLLNSIKLLILDCDGVMVDSKEANISYYNHLMQKLNKEPLTVKQEHYAHMLSNQEALALILPNDKNIIDDILAEHDEADYQRYNTLLKPEKDLPDFLKWLKKSGLKIAVCTNRTAPAFDLILDLMDLEGEFDFIATADMVEKPKPHPELLALILRHFNFVGADCLFIGDTQADLVVAQENKVHFMAFKSPYLKTENHLSSFSELKSILLSEKKSFNLAAT